MQSSQTNQPKHPGSPNHPERAPEHSPQRRPERHAPEREDRNDDDRGSAAPDGGQRHEVRKPANRR